MEGFFGIKCTHTQNLMRTLSRSSGEASLVYVIAFYRSSAKINGGWVWTKRSNINDNREKFYKARGLCCDGGTTVWKELSDLPSCGHLQESGRWRVSYFKEFELALLVQLGVNSSQSRLWASIWPPARKRMKIAQRKIYIEHRIQSCCKKAECRNVLEGIWRAGEASLETI